tara:strand:- start:288 stop:686 length:399 start_codon:yes stop_codon:yes gene_type:complete
MEAVVYGGGILGKMLVPHLVQSGYEVTIIDSDSEFLESVSLDTSVKTIWLQDSMMQNYLEEARVDIAELFLAVSSDDHANLLEAQTATTIYNVQNVICLVENPQLQHLFNNGDIKIVGSSLLTIFQDIETKL